MKKLLLVEDDPNLGILLQEYLQLRGDYDVILCKDGEEGLEAFSKGRFDLCILDVMMPKKDGFTLGKEIRKKDSYVPIIFATAKSMIGDKVEAFNLGGDDYITKPFNTNLLISRCNNLVNSRRLLQEKFSKQPQAFAQMLATNPMDKEMLDRAMAIIERHLDNTDFNVNIFAREMGMARTNLFTKLKAVTGQTPNDFILSIRLKKGAVMLRNNPELNITEISDRIGFSSSRYFSKCFKEIYHVSPLAYRKGEEKEEEGNEETDQ
jgi:DNA-binding response OmpR family regulator